MSRPVRLNAAALVVASVLLAGCGGPPEPAQVETCLREAGLGVAQQSGLSAPVEAKINFDIASGTPDPERSGSAIFYASEDDAKRNLEASGGSGPKGEIRREGTVLYTPFGAQSGTGLSATESETLVEDCVTTGSSSTAEDDDDSDKKKKRKRK